MAALDEAGINQRLSTLSGWKLIEKRGHGLIEKSFQTGNFLAGLDFVTRIADLAEEANHHPDVLLTYPRVTIHLTTHDAGGLTAADFELARRIDALQA